MAKYKYLNKKNGAIFESDVLCGGGPWVPFDDAVKEQTPEQEPEQEPEQTPEQEPEETTKKKARK